MTAEPAYYCYRLHARNDPDRAIEDHVYSYISSVGGWISIRADCMDFYVPAVHVTFFLLRWSSVMERKHILDHY